MNPPIPPPVRFDRLTVRPHEAGPDGRLRPGSLFDYLQDAAAGHADQLGCGIAFLRRRRLLWVLSRIRLEIRRYPAIGETLELETYPSGPDKLFATRQFTLRDADGETAARASSCWLLLDGATFRPRKVLATLELPLPANGDRIRHFTELDKLAAPDGTVDRVEHRVRHSHIDVNCHLNNAFYAAFIADTLGELTGDFRAPRELQVNFLHAGALGDRIACGGTLTEDGEFRIDGQSPDGQTRYFQSAGRI